MLLPYGPEYALELIRENARTKDPFLDLGNCRLTELPEELGELTHLRGLNLASVYKNERGEIVIPRWSFDPETELSLKMLNLAFTFITEPVVGFKSENA